MSTFSNSNIKLHDYQFPRGQYVKLLLDDTGIDYEYISLPRNEWPEKKAELTAKGIPVPTLPYLEVDGQYVGNVMPLMRYISSQVGNYLGGNDLENHYLDRWSDIANDWFVDWIQAHYKPTSNKETEKAFHSENGRGTMYHKSFETLLGQSNGPYVLGEKISYVDFVVYYNSVEDGLYKTIDSNKYPNLKKLFDAIDSRPTLKK